MKEKHLRSEVNKTNQTNLLPVLTIYDLQVHVDSENKHMALHADLIKRGWRKRVCQRN